MRLLQIQHHSALQLASLHVPEDLLEVVHLPDLDLGLDHAPGGHFQGLLGVSLVADGAADDLDHLEDEQGRRSGLDADHIAFRDADTDESAADSQGQESGGIGGVVGVDDDGGLGADAVGDLLDLLAELLAGRGLRIEEVLGAALEDEVLLGGDVDADDAQPEAAAGQLDGDVAESAAGAAHDQPVAGLGLAALDGGVGGQAGAQHGRGVLAGDAIRDGRDVVRGRQRVLLEGAGRVVAGDLDAGAAAVQPLQARRARPAAVRRPLDAHPFAHLAARHVPSCPPTWSLAVGAGRAFHCAASVSAGDTATGAGAHSRRSSSPTGPNGTPRNESCIRPSALPPRVAAMQVDLQLHKNLPWPGLRRVDIVDPDRDLPRLSVHACLVLLGD